MRASTRIHAQLHTQTLTIIHTYTNTRMHTHARTYMFNAASTYVGDSDEFYKENTLKFLGKSLAAQLTTSAPVPALDNDMDCQSDNESEG